MPIKVKMFSSSKAGRAEQIVPAEDTEEEEEETKPAEETTVQPLGSGESSSSLYASSEETKPNHKELVIEASSSSSEEEPEEQKEEPKRDDGDDKKQKHGEEEEAHQKKHGGKSAKKRWNRSTRKKKNETRENIEVTETESKKDKPNKAMDLTFSSTDMLRDEKDERKAKKSRKQKTDIRQAFRNFRSRLSGKRKSKNDVQEISIKPETETPQECWASESTTKLPKHSPNSSRTSSADSKHSKAREEDDDGIEVIYDAAYQGGESE